MSAPGRYCPTALMKGSHMSRATASMWSRWGWGFWFHPPHWAFFVPPRAHNKTPRMIPLEEPRVILLPLKNPLPTPPHFLPSPRHSALKPSLNRLLLDQMHFIPAQLKQLLG